MSQAKIAGRTIGILLVGAGVYSIVSGALVLGIFAIAGGLIWGIAAAFEDDDTLYDPEDITLHKDKE